VLVCPTTSVRSETKQARPNATIFPQEITSGVWRCGFNARSSFGAHSCFASRPNGNLLIDSPRYGAELTESLGKLAAYRFESLLPGHGWPAHLPAEEMTARLVALVARMRHV
jgi:hypothetical protein